MTEIQTQTLAVIGAGNWGRHLARNFYELGVLRTLCDTDEKLQLSYQSKYPDVICVVDAEEVFSDPAVHQVVIAAPAVQHFCLAKRALEAGKDVFVEKPLCLDVGEAKELVELSEEKQKVLMVGHLLHYHPAFILMKQLVESGEVGTVKHVACHRLKLGRFRTEESVLWSFSPHDFSMVLSLTGEASLESISCRGNSFVTEGIEDMTMTCLSFSENVTAHIYASWVHPHKEQKVIVVGTKGLLTFDDTKPWREKLSIVRKPIEYRLNGVPEVGNEQVEYVDVQEKEPLNEECLHFLQCCKERKRPTTCGREGLRTLQALQGAEKSLKCRGAEVSLIVENDYYAHPTAVIDQGALIGKETNIWHFSHIFPGAEIGSSCNIGQNVTVFGGSRLGNNCKVQNNVSVYSGVFCEDNVFIGPSAVFTNVKNPRSEVIRRGQYDATYVCQGASIGANATIVCGVTIGQYSFIGAGAVVTRSTKPFSLMMGNPARQVGWMSRNGQRLGLPLSSDEPVIAYCSETGEAYRLIDDQLQLLKADKIVQKCVGREN